MSTIEGRNRGIALILFHLQSNCLHLKKKKSWIGLSDFIMPFRMAHFNSFVVSTECYCIYLLMQRTEKNMTFQNVLFPMICPSSTSMGYLYFIFLPYTAA